MFSQQGWTLYRAGTLDTAVAFLRGNPVPVIITEPDLPLANWKDLLAAIVQLPRAPLLIVASRLADERLWAEVLNLGGYDLLCEPFQKKEVLWVLNSAWRLAERDKLVTDSKGIVVRADTGLLAASGG
jgi:DNA-binding response OmpR family regulator